jgi:hypothetical protein
MRLTPARRLSRDLERVVGQFEGRASLELDYVAVRVRHVGEGMVGLMFPSPYQASASRLDLGNRRIEVRLVEQAETEMGDSAVVAGPILSPWILVEGDGVSSTRRSEEDHPGTIAKLLFESEDSLVET